MNASGVIPASSGPQLRRDGAHSIVTVLTGLALSAALVLRYGADRDILLALFVVNILVAISRHDIERRVIPNRLVVPAWAIALAANTILHPSQWSEWLLASLAAGAFFLVFARVSRGGVGMGDVKLVAFLGAALGADVLPALVVGTAASGVLAAAILVRHGAAGRNRTYPLGPFLAAGAIVTLLFL